ncbi:MAG: hypothetical protein ACPGGK_04365 [Pikeienuella sp.]
MTNFGVLLGICGLNPDSAAVFLDTPRRRVIRWIRGGVIPPETAISALSELHQQQQKIADAIMESWDNSGRPAELSITVAADDESARETGWPSVGAQMVAPMIAQTYIWPAKVELAQAVKPVTGDADQGQPDDAESIQSDDSKTIAAE